MEGKKRGRSSPRNVGRMDQSRSSSGSDDESAPELISTPTARQHHLEPTLSKNNHQKRPKKSSFPGKIESTAVLDYLAHPAAMWNCLPTEAWASRPPSPVEARGTGPNRVSILTLEFLDSLSWVEIGNIVHVECY